MFKRYIITLIVIFIAVKGFAQRGLGDPLINVDFGAGSSVHGPEIPGVNNYAFSNLDYPPEGSYAILNSTAGAGNIWWNTTDHTGNTGGYMMVLNTRPQSYETYIKYLVKNLCTSTNYRVGIWMLNLLKTTDNNPPDIRIIVETASGVLLQDIPVGPLPQTPNGPEWVHKTCDFTLNSAESDVNIYVKSITPGGANANEIAIDDMTVNTVGQIIDAEYDDGGDFRIACVSSAQSYSATATTPDPGNVIKWQRKLDDGIWVDIPGETSTKITFVSETVPGRYRYRASSSSPDKIAKFSCSVVTNELSVWVQPLTTVSAGPPKFYLRGGSPVLLEGSSNSDTFYWTVESGADISSLSSTTVLNPLASPGQTTTYVLHASPDNNTCGVEVISKVTVSVADDINLPNTFTPNGDGINDTWVIGGINSYQSPVVQVYDRNGQLVYRSVNGSSPWDGTYKGKFVPAGNYYYIVDLHTNGIKLSGSVTVIR
ncbi:T9SS type B sorting domain-containing protein [Mucilaginibacter sp. HD30]